jgi:hypothetical protein
MLLVVTLSKRWLRCDSLVREATISIYVLGCSHILSEKGRRKQNSVLRSLGAGESDAIRAPVMAYLHSKCKPMNNF